MDATVDKVRGFGQICFFGQLLSVPRPLKNEVFLCARQTGCGALLRRNSPNRKVILHGGVDLGLPSLAKL
jgi:hypothetical protein